MRCTRVLLCLGVVMGLSTACTFSVVPRGQWVIQQQPAPQPAVQPQGDMMGTLMGCANSRGWMAERTPMGGLQVRMDNQAWLEYRFDANNNPVMGMRFEANVPPMQRATLENEFHMRGNQLYACGGYGTPVYVGMVDQPAAQPVMAPPPPQVYAAQPMPQGPLGPMCQRLNDCYNDMIREACRGNDPHCSQRYMFHSMPEEHCDIALREFGAHQADIERQHPGFVLPQTCHAPGH